MKQFKTNVDTKLQTKSYAELEAEIASILKNPSEEKSIDELLNASGQFAGWSPPHTRGGVPYEKIVKDSIKFEDENT